jgi:two-component system chemotaxis sensor kinase CheA
MSLIKFDDPEMQEIFDGFLVETKELLESLSQDLMAIESQPDNMDMLNGIFRCIHTIKGTASFMGFDSISVIAHDAEDLLNKMRRGEMTPSLEIIDVMLEVHDWIKYLLERLEAGEQDTVDYSVTLEKIALLKNKNYSQESTFTKQELISETPQEPDDKQKPPLENISDTIESQIEEKHSESNEDETSATSSTLDYSDIALGIKTHPAISALQQVLNNKSMVEKEGDFTDMEIALIDSAFYELNVQLMKERLDSESKKTLEEILPDTNTPSRKASSDSTYIISSQNNEKTSSVNKIQTSSKSSSDTIRIDVKRVETLMDLSGELVLGRNRLSQVTNFLANQCENKEQVRDLIETAAQLDFVTSEIQSAVMKMRMIPVGKLYQKAPRIVRDLSKEFGKTINLIVKGEETEIDRSIIEELNDPLVHMIRNSCDHGIESADERIAAGKPAAGTIILDAEQEGNNIVLRISDDGKGIVPEKILAKAIEKGLVSEDYANQMSKRDILQLIFLPGFSTAAKVSKVSGRGVGMDVVRTNITNLKGIIEIESEPGIGSTFIIKLPLTLAIIQGLLVNIKNETYALPLSSVVEVVSISDENIFYINQQEVIRIREDVLPLLRLDSLLGLADDNNDSKSHYVVVVGLGVQRIGFAVDELLGQQEIVIKSLGDYLGHIKGIAGSTILGDGRVIMIIDVAELIQTINQTRKNAVSA